MDIQEYRRRGKEMVDYIADYLENIRDRRVFPNVKPGYMHNLLPESAPVDGEKWDNIMGDIERVIMPGVTHWQSPHMHAYFPALNSFPSMLGDMLADAINCLGFTWASSPACTELETIVMNWLGKMIGLPDDFLHLNSSSKGGGVIQTTASESTLVCLLAGRTQAIKKFHEQTPGYQDAEINARLVAYCSDQSHSSVEKAALIGLVRMRYIESNEELIMRGQPLKEAIENDIKQGLIPFWVCCTLGTTGACAFDNLDEIGNVCREFGLWLHIDAAYAGSALICPEYRTWLKGIEKANSIAFNPSKWLMVHFDCTAMWVKDSTAVHRTFNVEPLYLQHENSGLAIDYMHWQIPLSKRFRSLKLWFVLRSFGIKGLQKHIREGVRLAQKFEALVLADHRFEIPAKRHLGMVVFRIKGENELTEKLLKRLNHRGKLHCVPASLKGKYIIRFTVTSTRTTIDDILEDWNEIKFVTSELLDEMNVKIDRAKVSLKDTKEKNEAFGSSLLLSNSPMSPKVVNGSFAAIFDADEFLAKTYAGIRIANPTLHTKLPPLRPVIKRPTNFTTFQHQDSPSMRRRVRGILMSGKQFSLDSRMDLVVQSCYDSNNEQRNANPIREDSEEVLEVYESPGTPPLTPPPTVSPLINHHSRHHQQQALMEQTKFFLKSPTISTIHQTLTPTNSLQIEMLDPIRIPNKYKMVENLKKSTSSSLSSTLTPTIKQFRQAETTTDKFRKKIFSLNQSKNNFDDNSFSPIMKKSSSVEHNCRNSKSPLASIENKKLFTPIPAKRTTIKNISKDNNISGDTSTDMDQNNDNVSNNFKSTVNTIIVKQNLNLNQHKKKSNHHSKNKSKSFSGPKSNNEEIFENQLYFINGDTIISKQISSPLKSPLSPPASHIYHGKRFLDQASSDGIFAFYNLAFKAVNSFQRCNSMSDISEEDISAVDTVDWDAVKINFNKRSSLSFSSPIAQNSIKSKLKQASRNSSSHTSTESKEDISEKLNNSINENIPKVNINENPNDVINELLKVNNTEFKGVRRSRENLFLTGLKIRVSDEEGCRVKTSYDSSASPSISSYNAYVKENNCKDERNDMNEINNEDDTIEQNKKIEDNKKSVENDNSENKDSDEEDDDDDDDDDESNSDEIENDDEQKGLFHDTTASSTPSSQTSGFSHPLWSSLEVVELLSRSSSNIQIGPDGWTIVSENDKKVDEVPDNSDICKKCGHNSIVTPSNDDNSDSHNINNDNNKSIDLNMDDNDSNSKRINESDNNIKTVDLNQDGYDDNIKIINEHDNNIKKIGLAQDEDDDNSKSIDWSNDESDNNRKSIDLNIDKDDTNSKTIDEHDKSARSFDVNLDEDVNNSKSIDLSQVKDKNISTSIDKNDDEDFGNNKSIDKNVNKNKSIDKKIDNSKSIDKNDDADESDNEYST